MLVNVKKELEKEYIIHNIEENINYNLTSNNLQILNYLLSMKGNITVKDLAMFYKNYNNYKKINDIVLENIMPLIDKEIIVKKEYTKGHITKNISNVNIAINSNIIDIDKNKIKYLNLKKIIR